MPSPFVRVLGAYKLATTTSLFEEAMELKFGGCSLSQAERTDAERHVRSELEGAALVEVAVSSPDNRFSVDDFAQPGSDQAPYGEVFLSEDGRTVLSKGYQIPDGEQLRIAFWLHFVNPAMGLRTSYSHVAMPPLEPMPKRLADLITYEPVA